MAMAKLHGSDLFIARFMRLLNVLAVSVQQFERLA